MSSSLFYDCYASYQSYPKALKINGCKTFKQLVKGDKLFYLEDDFIQELTVRDVIKIYKRRYVIPIEKFNSDFGTIIDIGPDNILNVIDNLDASILEAFCGLVSTDRVVLKNYKITTLLERENELNEQIKSIRNLIIKIQNL